MAIPTLNRASMRSLLICIFLNLAVWIAFPATSGCAAVGGQIPVIAGAISTTRTIADETLGELAQRTGFGYENLLSSNPHIDPWIPGAGTKVTLPGQALLPAGSKPGLVINLAELRLFHIFKTNTQNYQVTIYPLGVGRSGRETPRGEFRIIVKKVNPAWRVPEGLRKQDPTLPVVVPPGPENPLGSHWLGLSASGYGIHGTNRPLGVGRRVSYGCIRMYPEQIANLFEQVNPALPVVISYQPIKAARQGKRLLLEVHPDYLNEHADLFQTALTVISKTGWPGDIDYARVKEVVHQQEGLPVVIGSTIPE